MFASKSSPRSRTARLRRHHDPERIVSSTVKAVAESLERRVLLSATAAMVADINTATANSNVSSLANLGNGKSVFFANDGFHGEEPYVTDGTAAGTTLIKDIDPGPGDSVQLVEGQIAYSGYQSGVMVNGRLFFAASDGVNGSELWTTDGTLAGTALVKDINPGSASSYPGQMVAVGNSVFFVADDGTNGPQLWKSDGTSAGTSMVTTIGNLPNGPDLQLGSAFNGRLFFTASDGVHGRELWSSDGTAAGTAMVMDINPGQASSFPSELTVCGSQLFFSANDGADGYELWVTDGTSAGTRLVSDLAPGSASSTPRNLTDVNGTLFFDDWLGSYGDLCKSDGTSAGTVPIESFESGVGSMIDYGGRDYFMADDGVSGDELWQSDGTGAGTTQVADLAPGSASAFPNAIGVLTVAGSNLFFAANAGGGEQLYVITSVGAAPTAISPAGSVQIVNYEGNPPHFQAVGSGVYFTGFSLAAGGELWHSDGTASGTAMVDDINTTTIGSNPSQLAEINGRGVFAADDSIHGAELWVTDGSAGGTTLLKDIVPGAADGTESDWYNASFTPVRLGNYLYFAAGTGNGQLWRTDGTANGTTLCLSFLPASPNTGYTGISQLTSINGSLYFFADDGTGSALYISDGTPNGTTRLQYLSPPISDLAAPSQFSVVGNEVVFAATDSAHGTEPWVTDGTPAGTKLLMDIDPGTASSLPDEFNGLQRFVNLGMYAYFAVQSQMGAAIWRTDGTSAGTSIVEDFSTNATVGGVVDLTPFNGKLYFSTTPRSGSGGGDLWTSDGTASGTQLFESFPSNTSGVYAPENLTVVGNTLFFSAAPSADDNPQELFASNGTTAGTMLLPGAGPGQAGLSPSNLANVEGTLYFTALDEASTLALWRVDRSPSGGMSIEDVWSAGPSAVPPNPTNFAALDGTFFFQATDQTHGAELWKLNLLYASAGGPYLAAGNTAQLDASASRDPNPTYPLSYSWDLNGDGIFGETGSAAGNGNETGVNPIFDANQFYPGVYPVTVQVTGSWQNIATATSYVSVPPREHFAGDTVTFSLGTAVTNASIQSWSINWGDGTPVENYAGSTTSVSHVFATASGANPFMVQVSAISASSAVEPLPMPVTIYADPVLNNGLLTLTGTSGSDSVTASSINGVFEVGLNGAIRDYNSSLISRFIYNDGGGNDQISLRDYVSATLNLSTGNDSITNGGQTAIVNAGTGKIRLDASSGSSTIFTASSGSGIRQIQFSSISINNTGTVLFANSSATLGDYSNHANRSVIVVDAGGLNIASGGTLDMGDNDMILKYAAGGQASADSQVFNLLQSGITPAGDWSGTGITSSEANYDSNFGIGARALGWMDNNDIQDSSFDGVSLSDFNEVMIKFTYYGDVDLSGTFDATDVNQLIAGRSHTPGNTGWEFDDLDYDGLTSTAQDQTLFFTGRSAYQHFGAL